MDITSAFEAVVGGSNPSGDAYRALTLYNRCIYNRYMKTLLNIKTDKEVKAGVQKIAKELGFPLSTIINAYLKQLLREKRVNFTLPLMPNKKTARLLKKAREDYKRGRNISPVFETAEAMDAYLHS